MDDALKMVLVIGDKPLANEVVVCLRLAGHQVIHTADIEVMRDSYELVIVVGNDLLTEKQAQIGLLEKQLVKSAIIAISTESIPLSAMQEKAINPERIMGLNWTSPVNTTFFLELISNEKTSRVFAQRLFNLAKTHWKKDPYHLHAGMGIRSRMMAAMFREAAFLVENGYASVKDIDRACRNDPGYYLPFAGNFRYMDLMGTYAYGMVMKDLNPELAGSSALPEFFKQIIDKGGKGMENNEGFYTYTDKGKQQLMEQMNTFSVQIRDLIFRYGNKSIRP